MAGIFRRARPERTDRPRDPGERPRVHRVPASRTLAALATAGLVLAPSTALAVDWEEWKYLVKNRPVAVFFAIPPLILTSPFMGMKWAWGKVQSDDEYEDFEYQDE